MRVILLFLAMGLVACAEPAADGPLPFELALEEIAVPSDSVSGEPWLTNTPSGVAMSWLDKTADGASMRVAHLGGTDWEAASTIAQGDNWFVNWADVPSIAANGQEMWAHWLEYNGTGRYSYGVRVSHSTDAGQTWGAPRWLHEDTSPVEHGFGAMAFAGDAFHAVWLDGRKWADGVEEMTVRTRTLGGDLGPELTIDDRTCDCCPNAITATGDGGLVMAYRNRSEDEIRDIYTARMNPDGSWSEPAAVHDDGWQIAACPVNGPALAAEGDNVAIAWFTAPDDNPHVNVAFSTDGGVTFEAPHRMDTGGAIGRVDIILLDDGSAVASWIQAGTEGGGEAGILARRVTVDGQMSAPAVVMATSASRASGYPRMVRDGDALVFAWTGTQPTRSVRTARGVMSL